MTRVFRRARKGFRTRWMLRLPQLGQRVSTDALKSIVYQMRIDNVGVNQSVIYRCLSLDAWR